MYINYISGNSRNIKQSACKIRLLNYANFSLPIFKGKPNTLEHDYFVRNSSNNYNAEDIIALYEQLRYAKYTDITHDTWRINHEPRYSEIRQRNLSFLDKLTDTEEKAKFISYYESLTGFPNLEVVSQKIINEIYRRANEAKCKMPINDKDKYQVIMMGYNNTCSVGHKKALPGSDLDGAYVILKGSDSDYENEHIVNNFKAYLWENTDTRILSYNHQAAFPQVYTEKQFYALLNSLEKKASEINFNEIEYYDRSGFFPKKITKEKHFLMLKQKYTDDYIKANQFYIELCEKIDENFSYRLDYNNPSKELAKNFGFLLEVMITGAAIIGPDDKDYRKDKIIENDIRNTKIGKFVNLSQLYAIRTTNPPKSKLILRSELVEKYKNSSIDEKYEIIKEIIKAGCGENNNKKYEKYFSAGKDNFKPLLKVLGKEEE